MSMAARPMHIGMGNVRKRGNLWYNLHTQPKDKKDRT